jgi:hypothetical protein
MDPGEVCQYDDNSADNNSPEQPCTRSRLDDDTTMVAFPALGMRDSGISGRLVLFVLRCG